MHSFRRRGASLSRTVCSWTHTRWVSVGNPLQCRFQSSGAGVTQTVVAAGTATGDAEVDKWIGAARAGDAESAFELGVLLRMRAQSSTAKGADTGTDSGDGTPGATSTTTNSSSSSTASSGPEVLKEIEMEKKAARVRRKEKMTRKREAAKAATEGGTAAAAANDDADMPVVTLTPARSSDVDREEEELNLSWQHWLRRAAGADHVTAQVYLANNLLHLSPADGLGGSFVDIKEAERLYARAGKSGMLAVAAGGAGAESAQGQSQSQSHSADAFFNLGTLYFSGAYDSTGALVITQDEQKSIAAFTQAAQLGDAGAQYWMGHCHVSGEGGQPEGAADVRKGVALLRLAAAQQHPAALYYLCTAHRSGLHDHQGQEVITADQRQFHALLDQAVEAGDVDALFCKADLHMNGLEGVTRDESKAVKFLEKAVQLDHVDSITTLGAMHYAGRGGLEVNKRRAFELYNKASELGSREAWLNLASMHYNGDGVPKSEALAREIMAHVKKLEASD